MIGSSNSAVKSIKILLNSSSVKCEPNTTPGTIYITLPSSSTNTHTIEPYSNSAIPPVIPQTPTTFQTHDPITGELVVSDVPTTTEPTPTPDTPTTPEAPTTPPSGETTLGQITTEAEIINTADVDQVLSHTGESRNTNSENNYNSDVVERVVGSSEVSTDAKNAIVNFVTYSTLSTDSLGAGERDGVVNSFKSAFGKLSASTEDWNDVIKITNGRRPGQTSDATENRAKINFGIVCPREPNRDNPNDGGCCCYGLWIKACE